MNYNAWHFIKLRLFVREFQIEILADARRPNYHLYEFSAYVFIRPEQKSPPKNMIYFLFIFHCSFQTSESDDTEQSASVFYSETTHENGSSGTERVNSLRALNIRTPQSNRSAEDMVCRNRIHSPTRTR